MSEPLKNFIDALQDSGGDEELLSSKLARGIIDKLQDVGENLLNNFSGKEKDKPIIKPSIPSGPTPTYSESVLEPSKASTLYNVTNMHEALPVVTKNSHFFNNIKYRVRGFGVAATYKNDDNHYSLISGEKVGFSWFKKANNAGRGISATYNVGNGKADVGYSVGSPCYSYKVSAYNDDGNNGVCVSYSRIGGFNTVFSCDENSVSAKAGFKKNYSDCMVDLSAYATMGDDYKRPFVGVMGRVTF